MEGALLGLGLSTAISALARWQRLLTRDGAIAAIAVGTAIFASGGWRWATVLLVFFVTSSLWTRISHVWKGQERENWAPSAREPEGRTAAQVMANGAIPVAAALAYGFGVAGALPAFLGAMAAMTADTWATEVGLLSPSMPRLITTGERVEPGRSGGVTFEGTAGGILGACTIATLALLFWPSPSLWLGTFLAGVTAMFIDSILGATIQEGFRCPACGREGERAVCCNRPTERRRGIRGITNNAVNVLASGWGAAVGIASSVFL
ncbi:MAG: DUF92 domain-containing protein [Armatimonadota bacterium]|nr:DUF92 domain-containing protein [Armatimonadota bacterium]